MNVHGLPHSFFLTHSLGTKDPIKGSKSLLDNGTRISAAWVLESLLRKPSVLN